MKLDAERIEKSPHAFWMNTCGIDTYRRSALHARHDTPWNGFSLEGVLVCTLWLDEIVDIFDDLEHRVRRFVEIGGKAKAWKGPAVAHGKEADDNLRKASTEKRRVVGYEAEPDAAALQKGDRKVAHFYLDRAHELKRIFSFSNGQMLDRLKVDEAFKAARNGTDDQKLEAGYLFELIEPQGEFPGKLNHVNATGSSEGEDATEEDEDEDALFDDANERRRRSMSTR